MEETTYTLFFREYSGSVVECLTPDQGAASLSLISVTALGPLARHITPSLVLVPPRKSHPYITERLLMGRKESNHRSTLYLNKVEACVFGGNSGKVVGLFQFFLHFVRGSAHILVISKISIYICTFDHLVFNLKLHSL